MTREEAITVLKAFMENPLFSDVHKQAFNIAIYDIKQRHDWDINNLILINKDNYEPLEQEPKTGHWIEERTYIECPNCHDIWHYEENQTERFKVCPTCGERIK